MIGPGGVVHHRSRRTRTALEASPPLAHSHSLTHFLSLSHTHSLTHTYIHTHTLSLSLSRFGKRESFFIDDLLVRVHFIIVMIRWTGLAPWEFEFPFSGSLTSTFPGFGNLLEQSGGIVEVNAPG